MRPAPLLIGLGAVAAIVAGVFWMQRGAHIDLKGSILKVRTLPSDDAASVLVADFRFANPADYPFVVRDVLLSIQNPDGTTTPGRTIAEMDAKRMFDYFPALGGRFNESLMPRTKIAPRSGMDRMIMAHFDLPEAKLAARKSLVIRIVDLDGAVAELRQP